MKRCFKCQQELPIEQFYRHRRMADGRLGKCKECAKRDARQRELRLRDDPAWIESQRRRGREKYYRLYRPENPIHRRRDGWPDEVKAWARTKLHNAIRDGRIERPNSCESCGRMPPRGKKCGIEAHHEDYNKPLEVRWLCTPCHVLADAGRLAA